MGEDYRDVSIIQHTPTIHIYISLSLLPVYRAYVTWEENIPVDCDREHDQRVRLVEYTNKLTVGESMTALPDPFSLKDGWIQVGKSYWINNISMVRKSNIQFLSIFEYLKRVKNLNMCPDRVI